MSFRYLDIFVQCVQDVAETPTGPGTGYPFEMTLEDAMSLYWKSRTFHISGFYNMSWDFNNEAGVQTATSTGNLNADIPATFEDRWPEKMSSMVCTLPFFYGYNQTGTGTVTSTTIIPVSSVNFTELHIVYYAPILRQKTNEQTDLEAKYYLPFSCGITTDNYYETGYSTVNPGGLFATKQDGLKITVNGTIYKTTIYAQVVRFGAYNLNLDCDFNLSTKDEKLAE